MNRWTAIVLLTSLLSAFCASSAADPAKLGVVLPLSGEYAFVGNGIRDGISLAVAEDPAIAEKIKIFYEDDQGLNRKTTVSAVKKLIEIDKINLLAVTAVNSVNPIAKIVNSAKLSTLVIWDSNEHISSLGEYIYGYGFANEAAGADMAEFAIKKLGAKTAAMVTSKNEWSEIVSGSFASQFEKLGGKIFKNFDTQLEENDFRTVVSEIRHSKPDVVYAPLLAGPMRSFFKQLRQSGYGGKILTGDGFSDADIEALGAAAEGAYVMQMWYTDEKFQESYKKHLGRSGNGVNLCFAALGYDFVNYVKAIVSTATESVRPITSDSIKRALDTVSYKGILGEINFQRSRISDRRETVLVVKDGKFSRVD